MATTSELPWEELHGNLQAFVRRRVRNPADVDDLVQLVLLRIVQGLGSLRDVERLHAWVYRTARNAIVDYYRSKGPRREVARGSADDLDHAGSAAATPAPGDENEDAAIHELAACMAPMLRQLPPAYREAVTLSDIDGIAQADAARMAGVSVSGMKSRVQRGRRQLKAVLEACCRVDLDRRGGISGYESRTTGSCGSCRDDCK